MNDSIDRAIRKEITVNGPLEEVWRLWTTSDGAKRFFAPDAKIGLRMLGPYELYFNTESPRGTQGSEDCRILSYVPREMLSFEWNAPPEYPNVRKERSWVVIQLIPADKRVRVKLTHLGWGEGEEWDRVHDYFIRPWDLVLGRLEHVLSTGKQVDWENAYRPPQTYDA